MINANAIYYTPPAAVEEVWMMMMVMVMVMMKRKSEQDVKGASSVEHGIKHWVEAALRSEKGGGGVEHCCRKIFKRNCIQHYRGILSPFSKLFKTSPKSYGACTSLFQL